MKKIQIDPVKITGVIKPMNAVGGGPVTSNFTFDATKEFREANIPYSRTHDIEYPLGSGEYVDIHCVFPDFDKDVNDPKSYNFVFTDAYFKNILRSGAKPFYRLGSTIEHQPIKRYIFPPKDNRKWGEICSHLIDHYNCGWADGFEMGIEYWEIWNEPDGAADDAPEVWKKCWGGTRAQFYEFFDIAAKHLKACFPDCKIGGPATTAPIGGWVWNFLAYLRDHNTPLDFFSWHAYVKSPAEILSLDYEAREELNSFGFTGTESILNEWNYVKGWEGDAWLYSLRMEKSLKGASLIAGTMAGSQYQPLDMLMYYDARPCGMNGMFSTDFVCDRLKGYYPFRMFGALYRMGTAVPVESGSGNIYAVAAKGEGCRGLMFTHYQDEDEAAPETVEVDFAAITDGRPARVTYSVLDEKRDDEVVWQETVTGEAHRVTLTVPLFTTVFVKIEDER